VNDEGAREAVERLWKEGKRKKSEPIPREPEELSRQELTHSLRAKGLPRERAKRIADEIDHLQDLANWYSEDIDWYDVGEHEARTFLVVPLIEALGWDEKRVRIEWERKDAVLFDGPYSKKSKPLILIESKRLGHGLGDAPDQAVKYAESNLTCDRLVVTDGIRYNLFTKLTPFGGWSFSDYLNICDLTGAHRYNPDVAGAVSFLLKMLPKGAA
jgi:type I site-specific restriction endonuclease